MSENKELLIKLFEATCNNVDVHKNPNKSFNTPSTLLTFIKNKFPEESKDIKTGYYYNGHKGDHYVIHFDDLPPMYIIEWEKRYQIPYYRYFWHITNKFKKKELMEKFVNDLKSKDFYVNTEFGYYNFYVNVNFYAISHGVINQQITKDEFDDLCNKFELGAYKSDKNKLENRLSKYEI